MSRYPSGLLDWAGNRAGGVKKLFYEASGRPAGQVIDTRLLERLRRWATAVAEKDAKIPKAILLIGGPGNGKTEAVEFTIGQIDASFGLGGSLVGDLASKFAPSDGATAPRLATSSEAIFPQSVAIERISIVQDASVSERNRSESPAELLVEDLATLLEGDARRLYLACVNRGILDDALIVATETLNEGVRSLLMTIVQAVALNTGAPECWPLGEYPGFAVWPMDVETLTDDAEGSESAASQLLRIALNPEDWPVMKNCAAGEQCPFCTSRMQLSREPHRSSFLKILRWYELASGKRWNFRDLFSLISFLLAGSPPNLGTSPYEPCEWAARLLSLNPKAGPKHEVARYRGLLNVISSQYQHALFGGWPVEHAKNLRKDLVDLKLTDEPFLAALLQFLSLDKKRPLTATLASQLSGLSDFLDPGFADPDHGVDVSSNTGIYFRDIDRRFSLSVQEGRRFIGRYGCLSPLEIEVLKAFEVADNRLSEEAVRRHKPATAARVQALLRTIACRLVRRSVGVRSGVTKDAMVLGDFHRVSQGDPVLLHEAVKRVEMLLNEKERFVVTLNTTFGEPLPPPERRAVLTTAKQKVKALDMPAGDRPASPVRFLSVGSGANGQAVALTYDLFKSAKVLKMGMIPASLPRSVVALLDTTRARLSGQIVRDEESLDGSEIRIGMRDDVIVRELGTFLVRHGEAE